MEETTPTNATSIKYASFFRRLVATGIDGLIIGLINFGIGACFGKNTFAYSKETNNLTSLSSLITLVASVFYFVGFWIKKNGQTPGKKAMHIKIIKTDNQPLDIFSGIIRYFSQYVSAFIFGLGYLWVIFDKNKQGWHDKIASTYVIEADDQKPSKLIYAIGCFLPLLGFLAIVGLVATGMFVGLNEAKKGGSSEFVQELEKQKLLPKFTQEEADKLAYDVFTGVNNYRQEKGLSILEQDQQLCAYAQRRLEQLSLLGKYDDRKGFYEDTANNQMWNAYFNKYKAVNEITYLDLSSLTEKNVILNTWEAVDNSLVNRADFTGGCIRANTQFLHFVVGSPTLPKATPSK